MYDEGQMIMAPGKKFKDFIMIRKGCIKTFDKTFNYLADLSKGSFFGDYNILFDFYCNQYYQAANYSIQGENMNSIQSASQQLVIFHIDK